MEKRKIEIIEEGGIKEGTIVREKGDICSIEKELADAYVNAGLARCVDSGECGTRVAGVSKVSLDKVSSIVTSK